MSGGHRSDSEARRVSSVGALVTFFTALFGAGLLSLPNVLGQVGLPLGAALYLLITAGCAVSCHVLLRAKDMATASLRSSTAAVRSGTNVLEDEGEADADVTPRRSHGRPRHRIVTYGDLADAVLGPAMASITRWVVVVMSTLFAAGLVVAVCENASPALGWDDEMASRRAVALAILPCVAILLQIPWLQDLWIVSALSLVVYSAGVVGSTLFSAVGTIRENGNDVDAGAVFGRGVPEDMWEFKWDGVPAFLGSAVYAVGGISLVLPTSHSMLHPCDSSRVVCGATLLFGLVTIVYAAVGYAGGLGGGPGTGLSHEDCDIVTNCVTPPELKQAILIALSVAILLCIPVTLYPSLEMLEVMLTDRIRRDKRATRPPPKPEILMVEYTDDSDGGSGTQGNNSQTDLMPSKEAHHPGYYGTRNDDINEETETLVDDFQGTPSISQDGHSQQRSWKLRLFLAVLVVGMGSAAVRSFTLFSGLVGGVLEAYTTFVLPPLLYVRASAKSGLKVEWPMKMMLVVLTGSGIYSIIAGLTHTLVALGQEEPTVG